MTPHDFIGPGLIGSALAVGAVFLRSVRAHLRRQPVEIRPLDAAAPETAALTPVPPPPALAAPAVAQPPPQPEPREGHPRETTTMSIFTQILHKQITWGQAAAEIEHWGSQLASKASPQAQQAASVVISDLKQAAANAIMFADTAAGPLLAEGANVAGAALTTFLAKYLGPLAAVESPVTQDAINNAAAALKAEIDAAAAQALAALKPAAPATVQVAPAPAEHPAA